MNFFKTLILTSIIVLFTGCGGRGSGGNDIASANNITPQTTAIDIIIAYADDNTQPSPTVGDYSDAGITGVNADNLVNVNIAVDALIGTDVDTIAEIQAVVDDVIDTLTAKAASDAVLSQIGSEADDPDNVNSIVTVAQLGTILPVLTDINSTNETAYQDYIDTNPNAFANPAIPAEVQAMIDTVNAEQAAIAVSVSVLIQIGAEGDTGDTTNSVVTAAQLGDIVGLIGVVATNITAYQDYIDANPDGFSSPATLAEVQAMIDTVNAEQAAILASNAVLSQIGSEADDPDNVNSIVTVAQLGTILPVLTDINSTNETAYQDYIDTNPNAFANPAIPAEVQAMIDTVNAEQAAIALAIAASDVVLVQIGLEADTPDTVDSVVTVVQLGDIQGLAGVDAGNITAYQDYIDNNPDAFANPATLAEVQAMVDVVNMIIAVPIADAGVDQNIGLGTTAILDGSGSSDNQGDTLTYSWRITSKPNGSNAVLSDNTSVSPTFVADREGDYVIELIVNDGNIDSKPTSVTINANQYTRKNEIVTEHSTGLMWQDDSAARAVTKDWTNATNYCRVLTLGGYTDWYLPSEPELMGIGDANYSPAIDPAFVYVHSGNYTRDFYWTSTTDPDFSDFGRMVMFYAYRYSSNRNYKSDVQYVRCVRNPSIAIDRIKAYADDNTKPAPTVQDYFNAGVTGVNADNLVYVNISVDALIGTDVDTIAEIQVVVDTVSTEKKVPSGGESNVTVSQISVLANGTETSTVTVTVKDANSNLIPDATVTLTQNGSSMISTVTNVGNGTYTFTVKSTTAETVTYTATADTVGITRTTDVTFTASNYTRENEIVTEHSTGLMWQDDSAARAVTKDWTNAINYCRVLTLGDYTDWYLPSEPELMGIGDANYSPAIDPAFVYVHSGNYTRDFYWTSTTDPDFLDFGRMVMFYAYRYSSNRNYKSDVQYVRCVRNPSIAIDKIKAYADDNTKLAPTVQDYFNAGVTGVDAGNLSAINASVDTLTGIDVDTVSTIQIIVDEVIDAMNTPVADAGVDQNVLTSTIVTLDGNGSSDGNNDPLTYFWSFTSISAESNAFLSDDTAVNPTFIADVDGAYVLSLVVNDGSVDSVADAVTINATTANSGTLDSTFGSGGIVVSDGASGDTNTDDIVRAMALDSSRNIYVTGYSYNSAGVSDMVVWKYDANGSLDTTFGVGGIKKSGWNPGANGNDTGQNIALDDLGNIYVAGYAHNDAGNYDMVIWKIKANGGTDSTFGSGGIVIHDGAAGGFGNDFGYGIKLDSSGNIYVSGSSVNSTGNADMVIWKYYSSGNLDTTFGTGGVVVHDGAAGGTNGSELGIDIELGASGNIYVTGNGPNSSRNVDMVIWKYDATGSLDTTFGTGGVVVHGGAAGGTNTTDMGKRIRLDATGNIYVTGYSVNSAGNFDMSIWKYDATGSLDGTFGTGGIVVSDGAAGGTNATDHGYGIELDSSGNIYVSGSSVNSTGNADMAIWKYNSSGILDNTFGSGGVVLHDGAAGGTNDRGQYIVQDAAGDIYVAGIAHNSSGDWDMVIWKYN